MSKMQYLLSLQLKSLLYLVIFNTQTIPYKKTNKIHKSQKQRNTYWKLKAKTGNEIHKK